MPHSRHIATSGTMPPTRLTPLPNRQAVTTQNEKGPNTGQVDMKPFKLTQVYPLHVLPVAHPLSNNYHSTPSTYLTMASRRGACRAAYLASKSTAARRAWMVFVAAARRLWFVIPKRRTAFAVHLVTTAAPRARWPPSRSRRVRMEHGICSRMGDIIAASMGYRRIIGVTRIGAVSRVGRSVRRW